MGSATVPYAAGEPGTAPAAVPYPDAGLDAQVSGASGPAFADERRAVLDRMAADLKGLHRPDVAAAVGVNPPTLDSWVSQTRVDRNLPLVAAPRYVRATGSAAVLEWACQAAGLYCATPEQIELAELGRAYMAFLESRGRLEALVKERAA